jgi:hypothetical protein
MGFVPYTVQTRAQLANGTGFAASLKKVKSAPAQLTLSIRPAVVKQLGWADKNRIAVLLGEGDQRGLIRLAHSGDGSAVLSRREAGKGTRSEYYIINLGHVPVFPDRSEAKRWVKFERLEDGWVEVVLPRWADPQRQPATAPAVSPALSLAQGRPGARTLTGSLMGDPPPDRSALHERPEPTRGEMRRQAEVREAPEMSAAEAAARQREIEDAEQLVLMTGCFGLTRTEALYLSTLMDGRLASKERLLAACHGDESEAEIKIVDVYVHKLRAKLNTRLVQIQTVRSQGYRMEPASIARVNRLLAEHRDAEPIGQVA